MTSAQALALVDTLSRLDIPFTHTVSDGVHTVEAKLTTGRDAPVTALSKVAADTGITWRATGAGTLQAVQVEEVDLRGS